MLLIQVFLLDEATRNILEERDRKTGLALRVSPNNLGIDCDDHTAGFMGFML